MGLWLINSTPPDEALKPGGLVQFSAKSDGHRVDITSLDAKFGISRLVHGKSLPEDNPDLLKYGTVSYHTPENLMPVEGECRKVISGDRMILTKQVDAPNCLGVYEYTVPVSKNSPSILGYIKFRKWPWAANSTPPFNPVVNAAAPLFGLRNSFYRATCSVTLRDNGADGSLAVGGVYRGYGISRTFIEVAFPWKNVENGHSIELWIFYNSTGVDQLPGLPPYTPLIEVWGRLPGMAGPTVLVQAPVVSLGTELGQPDDTGAILFGNGGVTGDVVDIEDWAIYPDFRQAVVDLNALQSHSMLVRPDAPISFYASDLKYPHEIAPGRWFKLSGRSSSMPNPSFGFATGRRVIPSNVVIEKYKTVGETRSSVDGRVGYERSEPRLLNRADGFMLEGFISAFSRSFDSDCIGTGIGVQDGQYTYRVLLYKTAVEKTIALQATSIGDVLNDQHYPKNPDGSRMQIDWESEKLIRLAVDRARAKVSVWCDEQKVIEKNLTDLPRSRTALVEVGHILDVVADSQFNMGFLNYLNSYKSYEASDGVSPVTAPNPFTDDRSDGYSSVEDGVLKISKTSIHHKRTHHLFTRDDGIDTFGGAMFDFRARCPIFWDKRGTPMGGESGTGVGLVVYLGSRKLQVGFYNCGAHGRKIGVLPGSGHDKDIIDQTDLGKAFSADCDWTQMQNYRVIYRAFDSIQIWVGPNTNKPAITIPWRGTGAQFDLPTDLTPVGWGFGHFGDDQSSQSEWEFMRWGFSSGYEVGISQGYPNGVRHDQYGGRHLLFVDFHE